MWAAGIISEKVPVPTPSVKSRIGYVRVVFVEKNTQTRKSALPPAQNSSRERENQDNEERYGESRVNGSISVLPP